MTFLATIDFRWLSEGTRVWADTAATDTTRAQHTAAKRNNIDAPQPSKPLPDMFTPPSLLPSNERQIDFRLGRRAGIATNAKEFQQV
jgi:hypothetical protein